MTDVADDKHVAFPDVEEKPKVKDIVVFFNRGDRSYKGTFSYDKYIPIINSATGALEILVRGERYISQAYSARSWTDYQIV